MEIKPLTFNVPSMVPPIDHWETVEAVVDNGDGTFTHTVERTNGSLWFEMPGVYFRAAGDLAAVIRARTGSRQGPPVDVLADWLEAKQADRDLATDPDAAQDIAMVIDCMARAKAATL